MDFTGKLKKIVGADGMLPKSEDERLIGDESPFLGQKPLAAVAPRTSAQISGILKLCNKHGINVVVRGAGSSLTGASVPKKGSVVIDMRNFKKIHEINIEDRYAIVDPGVTIAELNQSLSEHSFFYPPDPGSIEFASIGGTISTNAGGLMAVLYGSTKEWVLGVEAVLADGSIIKTGGRMLKRSIGYDLTGLLVGSEGTLAVVTKAILKIWPAPESSALATAFYASIEDAGRTIAMIKGSGITPLAAEFLDRGAMELVAGQIKNFTFPKNANYMLLVGISSTREAIRRIASEVSRDLKRCGGFGISIAYNPRQIENMYIARKEIFTIMKESADRKSQSIMISDIVVPCSRLPVALRKMEQSSIKYGLTTVLFGHIGDGNIHANIVYDKGDKREVREMEKMQEEFARIAIESMGAVSGEHGIGIEKKGLLKEEFEAEGTLENISLMRGIKRVFDPKGILNGGKIFD
ncbi:MAG: FAD-binding protein [Candidatus Micrarchaeota archaeon]|nr:FAD-binding protein [Candidatus Micrarchaeota archaeon]MDE1804410.1 FAD-binding protein [Candidatus Micrarchaeota archaeon]MDE1846922.1 FAD-binding protein [Candidatus Micrarchaeota archaeon]